MTSNDDDTAAPTLEIQLTITGAEGSPRIPLQIQPNITSSELLSAAQTATKIASNNIKLIYRGRLIKADDATSAVSEYKLEQGSVIHCMGKPQATETAAPVVHPTTALPSVTLGSTTTATSGSTTAAAPATATAPLSLADAITSLKAQNPVATYQTALTTLHKLLKNIIQHPLEAKYRTIKRSNEAFGRRLGNLPGAASVILACGFVVNAQDQYELVASEESWNQLLTNERMVSNMIHTPVSSSFGGSTAAGAAAMPSMPGMPGLPGMPNLPGMPPMPMGADGMPDPAAMNSPEMQAMVQQLLSNPTQVQAMLQNPMVQNMLRSDPRFANNPMAQQALASLQNNPEAIAQMSQMFHAMQGGANGMPVAGAGAMPGAGASQQGTGNDTAQTEEEMIEEAIRRSLQDNNNNNNNNGNNN